MTDIENTDSEPALVPALTRAPVRTDSPTFAELGVRAETVEALAAAGITRAFAIQEYALPIALRGTDLIGQAPTGTGKTLGFGLPLLERISAPSEGADGKPQALIVVPTRELGIQVARDLAAAGATRGVRVLPIYGGVAYEPQVDTLKKGVEILVGTPGRLLDLAKQKQLKLDSIKALVLDEADRMLDLGFLEDVEKILAMLPEQRQTMLFSATMPDPIVALSRRFLRHPVTIHAGHTADSMASPLTKQVVYRTHPLNKLEMVARILQSRGRGLTMIFTRTKRAADRVAEDLDFRGFAVAAVHGDLGQGARERALRAFRAGKIDVLVATDVAARGLDVSGVTHVINYDCPEDPETYTHRIGRTGRAGATGVAVTFVDWEDMPRWVLIDKSLALSMPQPPETYHTSPALYSDLDIPADISGTLPTADRNRAGLSAEVEEDLGGTRRRGRGETGSRGGDSSRTAARPPRSRTRSRRGDDEVAAPQPVEAVEAVETVPDEVAAERAPRRRRRRTGDERPTTTTDAVAQSTDTDTLTVSDVPADNGDAEGEGEGGTRPRRRRRRSGRGAADASGPAESNGADGGASSDAAGTGSADRTGSGVNSNAGTGSDAPAGASSGSSDAPAGASSGSSDAPAGASSGSSDAPAAAMSGGSDAGVGTGSED